MTAARVTAPENPPSPQPMAPVAPQAPDGPRIRLAPGTQVTMVIRGVIRAGLVQLYEPEHTLCHDTFPVMFAYSGQWRMLSAGDVTVLGEAP